MKFVDQVTNEQIIDFCNHYGIRFYSIDYQYVDIKTAKDGKVEYFFNIQNHKTFFGADVPPREKVIDSAIKSKMFEAVIDFKPNKVIAVISIFAPKDLLQWNLDNFTSSKTSICERFEKEVREFISK